MKTTDVETTTKWSIDKAHSLVEFRVKHLMITTVTGSFKEYEASVETEGDDFATAKINFTADTNSIYTGDEKRDGHLKSAEFFDVEKYPKMTFTSTGIEKAGGDSYKVKGNLTIRDTSLPITVDVKFEGMVKDPWGNTRAGFTVASKINRKDFGLKWNVMLESGGVMVGDEVAIHCSVQLIRA